jgi:DNA polymerase elongation subunit (family B)
MYILNAWNIEGVQFEKPKLKMTGIEAVRSSTPQACREKIKEAFSIIMNGNQSELQNFVKHFEQEFRKLPFEQIAFPRGLNGMKEYSSPTSIYKTGTPIQVKGALLFNDMLKRKKVKNIPPLTDGDKIRFTYLKKPNPVYDTVIACPDTLPKEFGLDKYIDLDMQFEKSFIAPLTHITDVIGWSLEDKRTLEEFF